MKSKLELAAEIRQFLAKHGKRDANNPAEWNSPDGGGMEAAAYASCTPPSVGLGFWWIQTDVGPARVKFGTIFW